MSGCFQKVSPDEEKGNGIGGVLTKCTVHAKIPDNKAFIHIDKKGLRPSFIHDLEKVFREYGIREVVFGRIGYGLGYAEGESFGMVNCLVEGIEKPETAPVPSSDCVLKFAKDKCL